MYDMNRQWKRNSHRRLTYLSDHAIMLKSKLIFHRSSTEALHPSSKFIRHYATRDHSAIVVRTVYHVKSAVSYRSRIMRLMAISFRQSHRFRIGGGHQEWCTWDRCRC